MSKIILDLCGGTGAWSKPYKDAGYDVRLVTLPEFDVLNVTFSNGFILLKDDYNGIPIDQIYGILAAPPCTMFSFARTNAKKPRDLKKGMQCVRACLDIIWGTMEISQNTTKKELPLKFWALENPYYGFLKRFLGKPAMIFDPWEFGDGYQKKTALWGHFNEPVKNPIPMTIEMKELARTNSYLQKFNRLKTADIHPEAYDFYDRQARRAITPAGFAKAFFEANR